MNNCSEFNLLPRECKTKRFSWRLTRKRSVVIPLFLIGWHTPKVGLIAILVYVIDLLSVMCKVQDDPVIDRVVPDYGVLLNPPCRQHPRSQYLRYQSHPVIENEGDIQMPLWESKSFHPVRINNSICNSKDTGGDSSGCKCLFCNQWFINAIAIPPVACRNKECCM